jgi:cobalt-zinc-cadmium efflux system outer membrane protein
MTFVSWRNASALLLLLAWAPVAEGQAPRPSLTIESVVGRFLERNLAVEAARHRVDIARAEQIAAQLRPNPTLTLSAENVKFAGPTPAGELYEVGATYSQPIERRDKRRHRREVADATVAVAEAELAETLGQRLLDVKRAFYETLLARHAVEHALENRRAFESLVSVTEARFKEGAVAEGEVLKVRLERARFDTVIAQAQLALRQAGIKLLDLLGETDFSGAGGVTGDLVLPTAGVPDLEALKGSALQQRPSVRAAEHTVRLAERKLALERARSTADVSPFVGLRRVGENSTVLLGIAIPLPILDRNEGGIARAVAEEKVARAELTLRRNHVLAEVESAYQAWQSARERMTTFESVLLRQADDAQAIALRAYQEGAIELLGYLEAQRTRAEIRHQYLQSVLDARTGLLVLEQAVARELSR